MPNAVAIPAAFAVGGAAIGGSVIQAQEQRRAQKRALESQEREQRLAVSRAAAEQRRQGEEQRRVNRRRPNVASLLSSERRGELSGPGATVLAGANPTQARTTLGRASLLGAS